MSPQNGRVVTVPYRVSGDQSLWSLLNGHAALLKKRLTASSRSDLVTATFRQVAPRDRTASEKRGNQSVVLATVSFINPDQGMSDEALTALVKEKVDMTANRQ